MFPARALLLLSVIAARAQEIHENGAKDQNHIKRTNKEIASSVSPPRGCLYSGRWHAAGAVVRAHSACLRCACAAAGELHCARRACAALPDPPPRRCHVLHRKGACCPELHCPELIVSMEHGASARFDDDFPEVNTTHSISHGSCVEGGTVFAEGSALESPVSCEQCFCLRGVRRCVRPRCLPPPRGCRPRAAPAAAGACCPQRYYCDHAEDALPKHDTNDCVVAGATYPEGSPVPPAAACSACFCLRGAVRCQALSCAPPLLGCSPLLRDGECCAHRYQCHHGKHEELVDLNKEVAMANILMTQNTLTAVTMEDRSLHKFKYTKSENIVATVTESSTTLKEYTTVAPSIKMKSNSDNKVKRKTNDPDPISSASRKPVEISTSTKFTTSKVLATLKATKTTTEKPTSTTEEEEEIEQTSEQPESSIKIVINGTINCTTEYSSNTVPINSTSIDKQTGAESLLRTPNIDRMDSEAQTFNPNDIITDRNVNGGFEDEIFTINVTSSLRTNTSHSSPGAAVPGTVVDVVSQPPNASKTKEEYDYDYTEPTLPPSLPNLKIIPFVAADAVVDDDDVSPKDALTYPVLEREDKFPIYYPKQKENPFSTRREDVYHPSNYPTFTADRAESDLPALTNEEETVPNEYTSINDLAAAVHEYTIAASFGNKPLSHHASTSKSESKQPTKSFGVEKPAINLFSPPVETEGGFVPKGPGLMDEYYAVYPSTHAPSHVPHLTTSMQLDSDENESCTLSDGRRLPAGASAHVECSVCRCAGGALVCLPRPCPEPVNRPCTRDTMPADPCCPGLPCEPGEKTTRKAPTTTTNKMSTTTTTKRTTESPVTKTTEDIATTITERHIVEDSDANVDNATTTSTTSGLKPTKEDAEKQTEVKNKIEMTNLSLTAETKNIAEISTEPSGTIMSTKTMSPTDAIKVSTTQPSESVEQEQDEHQEQEQQDQHHSQEYEEEEEEDEGFSFGNVLKLLLSESYDATTPRPNKRRITTTFRPDPNITPPPFTSRPLQSRFTPTTASMLPPSEATRIPPSTITRIPPSTITRIPPSAGTRLPPAVPTIAPFIPLPAPPPHRPLYSPHNNVFTPTSVNRIDHLVLGEATAIKRPTTKPIVTVTTTEKPSTIARSITTARTYPTRKPYSSARPPETATRVKLPDRLPTSEKTPEISRHPAPPLLGAGAGLLKLAGCNIYGRMYRVGRIIAELSNPCQECRCTELGVQCRPLDC